MTLNKMKSYFYMFLSLSILVGFIKITGLVDYSWALVTGFIWFPALLFSFFYGMFFIIGYVTNLFVQKRINK